MLSPRDRAIALALAEAAMPEGHGLPGGSADTVARLEELLSTLGPDAARVMRVGLRILDAVALPWRGRRFSHLDLRARQRVLERIGDSSSKHVRWSLRAILTLVKAAHFDDPAMRARVGCQVVESPRCLPPEPWMRQVTNGREVGDDLELQCEVVIVGTGAGGAAAAYELARRGRAVLLLEAGDLHRRDEFSGRPAAAYANLYLARGATVAIGNVAAPVWAGRGVGGSTTINSGTCYRAPDRTLRRWHALYGLSMLGAGELDPFYQRVETMLDVSEAPEPHLGGSARVVARGADRLGLRHAPLQRNAPGCDGQGTCCFGCPTGAKRSTDVSYVPAALARGAQLVTAADVSRVIIRRGRARGVEGQLRSGARLVVHAEAVVVACGALSTPLLLRRSGVLGRSRYLGRNLSIHPATKVLATFDEVIDMSRGIPQSYAITSLEDEGVLCEGASMPMDAAAAAIPWIGPELMELMARYRHLASFGLMVQDTSRGDVREGRAGVPIVRYDLNHHDLRRMQHGIATLCDVFLEAGATRVLPFVHGLPALRTRADVEDLRRRRLSAGDFEVAAFHPLGTCRMGVDPQRSCVGPDHRVHDTDALYVVDGSAVPSSLGVNPQVTIMALALRAAEILDARLDGPASVPRSLPRPRPGLSFEETMCGSWTRLSDGKPGWLAFTITAHTDALSQFARRREARIEGVLDVEGLATSRPTVGTLGMDVLRTGRLSYELSFDGDDGRSYRFRGSKTLSARSPLRSMTHLPGEIVDQTGARIGIATVDFDARADFVPWLHSFVRTRGPRSGRRDPGSEPAPASLR